MADSRLPILGLLLAPFAVWRLVGKVQQYRRDRAASNLWTPALRAERLSFLSMGLAAFGGVLIAAAMTNETTPAWLMNTLWVGVGIAAVVMAGASVVAGYHRSREARQASPSPDPRRRVP